jgi:long-chain acyl-CoA synthetase
MYRYDKPDNLVDLVEGAVSKYPNNLLFGTKDRDGEYRWSNYKEFGVRVDDLRGGLAGLGIGQGDAVGIISVNSTEFAVTAFATYGRGGRFIPMYEAELEKVWKYIITDSAVKVLFVSKPEILEQIKSFVDEIPTLEKIILIQGSGEGSMEALEEAGRKNPVASVKPGHDEVAMLIYTSGTTGDPKGVLLSHGNITSNILAGLKLYTILDENVRGLSILPWAHSYGMTAELNTFVHIGASIGFMESVATLGDDIAKVSPTYLIAVPRVFNKIYGGIMAKMADEQGLPRKLFDMGIAAARRRRELAAEGKSCLMTNLKFAFADKVVFKKIRARFGGRLSGAMTASAAISTDIAYFFDDIGIPLYDVYGMTETSPAITMNCPDANRWGSVGRAIDQVKIAIDTSQSDEGSIEGEIIVYGPNVMLGYHNKPEKTAEVMTEDGGVRTGDVGRIDEDGYLFITGRIKEQYKLENGKYVFPASIEEEIKLLPLVENVFVYGINRPINVCLVVPDFEALGNYAGKAGLPTSPKELLALDQVRGLIIEDIKKQLKGKFASYEIPKKFHFLIENFTIENGLLTQTMKLKRRLVVKQYKDELDKMYE